MPLPPGVTGYLDDRPIAARHDPPHARVDDARRPQSGEVGSQGEEATRRLDRTDQSCPPSPVTENTTSLVRAISVGDRLPIVAAITPALPTNLGRSKRAFGPLGIRIVARLQR